MLSTDGIHWCFLPCRRTHAHTTRRLAHTHTPPHTNVYAHIYICIYWTRSPSGHISSGGSGPSLPPVLGDRLLDPQTLQWRVPRLQCWVRGARRAACSSGRMKKAWFYIHTPIYTYMYAHTSCYRFLPDCWKKPLRAMWVFM